MTEEAKDRFLGPTIADRRPASFSLVTARAVHNDYRRATIDNDDDFHHRPRSTTLSRPFRLPQIPKTNNTTTTESIPKSIYSPILSLSLFVVPFNRISSFVRPPLLPRDGPWWAGSSHTLLENVYLFFIACAN